MKRVKKVFISIFVVSSMLWGFNIEPFPKKGEIVEVFNTNCLQMTQSQQLLKAYIMKGLGSNFGNPSDSLKKAIPIYDKRIVQISDYFKERLDDDKAKESFDKALRLWRESKKMLETPPTKENALAIKENFSKMIPLLLEGTMPIAKKTKGLELLSLTGKLCRGPLKISIDYLLKLWGVDIPEYESEMESIIENFHKDLEELKSNPLNNEKSMKLLKRAEDGFRYFEFMHNSKNIFIPSLLSRKADENFMIIREIKKIYKSEVEKGR
jgi:hypothetical protein